MFPRISAILLLFFLSNIPCLAQQVSLESIQQKHKDNKFEEVISDIEKWKSASTRDSTGLEYAKISGLEAASYGMMNQFDLSIPKTRIAIALLGHHDSTEIIRADLYDDIAVDYRLAGDFENAKNAAHDLLEFSRYNLDTLSVDYATYVVRCSYPYLAFDKVKSGDSLVEIGLSIFLKIGAEMHPDINMAYNCKGVLNKNKGNYDDAAIWYNKARKVLDFNNMDKTQHYVTILHNEANVLRLTGKYEEAIENLLIAEKLNNDIHGDNTNENESVYTGLSNTYILMEDYDTGLAYGKKSLIMAEALYGRESAGYIHNELAYRENLLIANRNQEAIDGHKDLGRRAKAVFGDQGEAYSYYLRQVGKGLKNIGRYDDAISQLLSSLTDFGIDPFDLDEVYRNKEAASYMAVMSEIADSYYRKWKENSNIESLRKSEEYIDVGIQFIELFRKRSILNNSKLLFTSSHSEFIEQAIQIQYDLYELEKDTYNFDKGLRYIELIKNILFTENIKSRDILTSNLIPREEIQKAKRIRDKIQKAEGVLEESESDSLQVIAQNNLHDLYLEESKWFTNITSKYPEFRNRHYGNWEKNVEEIRSNYLSEGELILDYLKVDSFYYALGISHSQLSFRTITKEEINGQTFTKDPKNVSNAELERLSKTLLQPELGLHKDIASITIMPAGDLTYIPFEALPIGGSSALKHYSFRQLLNFESHRNLKNISAEVLAIAPEYSNQWNDDEDNLYATLVRSGQWKLPGALAESESIINLIGGKLLSGVKATKENFLNVANQYGILHLSMHTLPSSSNILKSSLVFSTPKDAEEDNLLSVEEIYNLDLNAQMVTLSACNTGTGEYKKGEGILSLAHAFGSAGVPSVVMSLWKVPDESTALIMEAYYEHLKQGLPKDAALKEAKLEYLDNTVSDQQKHPFYWSGFVVVGDISPIEFTRSSTRILYAGSLLAVGMLVFFFYSKSSNKRRALAA